MKNKNIKHTLTVILLLSFCTGNLFSQCEAHNCDPLLTGMNWNTACVAETGSAFVTVGWTLGGGDTQCTTPPNSWRIQISFAQNGQYIVESAASAFGPSFTYEYDEPNKTINATLNEQIDWLANGEIVIDVTGVTSTDCDLLLSGANIQIIPSIIGGCPEAFANQIANDALSAGLGVQPQALPIELIEFRGFHNKEKDVNELHWSTAVEINSDYFSLERLNPNGKFEEIAVIKSAGNSSSKKSYNFDDKDIAEAKVYYYRLKQFDLDGKSEVLPTIAIKVERGLDTSFLSYPNPVVNQLIVEYTGDVENDGFTMKFYDVEGRIVLSKGMHESTSKIDMTDLHSGIYFIRVYDASGRNIYEEKIVKI